MSDLSSAETPTIKTRAIPREPKEDPWQSLLGVLAGVAHPEVSAEAVELAGELTARPCDVNIRSGRFEAWFGSRPHHVEYDFELAAPAVLHVLRLLSLAQIDEPQVGVIEHARLGAHFPDREARALWIVPGVEGVDILIREAPAARALPGTPVPAQGAWALPAPFPRNQGVFVAASFPCPNCGEQPAQFEELVGESAFLCPVCDQAFVPRISRF